MGIRIDELGAAVGAQSDHFVPAIRNGETVKLSVAQISTLITALIVDSAPETLDTLNELAAALGDDPNFATTVANALATKASLTGVETLTNKTLTAPVIMLPQGEFIRGRINGLVLSNNTTDATNDIDIAAGSAASDGSTPVLMTLANGITKQLDAAWAAGSGNGGWLDGASMPNGTGFAYLMQRSDTGVSDVGFSASLSPTLPANYDRKRRIGSIIRKSGSILGFTQVGNVFTLNAAQNDVITTNPGTSAVLAAVSTPVGIKARAQIWVYVQQATSSARRTGLITSPDQADSVPVVGSNSNIVAGLSTSPGNASGEFFVRTNTSAQIRYRFDASDANLSIYINTAGWIDDQL